MITQETINRAVKIATRRAMYGNPVRRIIYIPETDATQSEGSFAVEDYKFTTAAELDWWDK